MRAKSQKLALFTNWLVASGASVPLADFLFIVHRFGEFVHKPRFSKVVQNHFFVFTVYNNHKWFRWCHMMSFTLTFAYLAFFRCSEWFGLPKFVPYANAVQLIMTLRVNYWLCFILIFLIAKRNLKCVGLAFEISDKYKSGEHLPPVVDQFCYCFNFLGIFTGNLEFLITLIVNCWLFFVKFITKSHF